jgi:copper chaperone CopZ
LLSPLTRRSTQGLGVSAVVVVPAHGFPGLPGDAQDHDGDRPYKETEMSSNASETRTYLVEGMTCDHCLLSVREEVSEVGGVEGIGVELASGRLTVSGAGFTDAAIQRAVEEAGYDISR